MSPFIHFAPHIGPQWTGAFSYQPISGSKPTTFSEPSGLRTVSFFASAANSSTVFGGCEMPASASIFLL